MCIFFDSYKRSRISYEDSCIFPYRGQAHSSNNSSGDNVNPEPEPDMIGDIKSSVVTTDHDGWIKLDGRALMELTTTQATNAESLGYTNAIPDMNETVLSQSNTDFNTIVGSTHSLIQQTHLPDIDLDGNTSADGLFLPNEGKFFEYYDSMNGMFCSYGYPGYNTFGAQDGGARVFSTIDPIPNHSHAVSVGLGGSGLPLPIQPRRLIVNFFIYLGN